VIVQAFPAVQFQEEVKPAVYLAVPSGNDDLEGAESAYFGDYGHHGGHGGGKRLFNILRIKSQF
jgi:hypothetical protein